jgi:hypothetical protein
MMFIVVRIGAASGPRSASEMPMRLESVSVFPVRT